MTGTVCFRIPSPLTEGNGPKEVGYKTSPLTEGIEPREVGYKSEGSGL